MNITYYISENIYKNVITTATRRMLLYHEFCVHTLSFFVWIYYYLTIKHKYYGFIWIPRIGITIIIIVFALYIHFLYRKLRPKFFISKIIKKNQGNIGKTTLELDDESIYVISSDERFEYTRNKVHGIKEWDSAYCITIPRGIYIVVPKHSGIDSVDEKEYTNNLQLIIKEIQQTAKVQSR
ncbi:hypothetical protein [Bacillus cereus group sp. BfR-BA-01380]|uniref:hypothetical protein n=1 Tax=Bacillus cereus group sp. BfR-BA-01380 TaxID=2920324 RepID=UPI001F5834F4|nr:hypothetical protein [Bacillus cereus group sp. BfR-BA-01380]